MSELRLLVTSYKTSNLEDRSNKILKNIIENLEKHVELNIIWIVIGPDPVILKNSNFTIENFSNFNNAIEIIETYKPDIVLIDGWIDFVSIAIGNAAKSKEIPIIANFMLINPNFIKNSGIMSAIRKRIRILVSKKIPHNTSNHKINPVKFYWKRIQFYKNTKQKLHIKNKSVLSFCIKNMTKYLPDSNMLDAEINICALPEIKEELLKLHYHDEKILLLSIPDFDSLHNKIESTERKFGMPEINKILFCTTPLHENGLISLKDEFDIIVKTIQKIQENKKFEIALKIHPTNSSKKEYEENLSKNNIKINIFQQEKLENIIKNYSIMMSYDKSSVILYGILFRRKLLFLNYFPNNSVNNVYHDEKISEMSNNIESLMDKIQKLSKKNILEEDFQEYFERYFGKWDGQCIEKISKLIIELNERKNLQSRRNNQ